MGLPVTERGGPPGGGGIGRPEALVGAWAGADGGGVAGLGAGWPGASRERPAVPAPARTPLARWRRGAPAPARGRRRRGRRRRGAARCRGGAGRRGRCRRAGAVGAGRAAGAGAAGRGRRRRLLGRRPAGDQPGPGALERRRRRRAGAARRHARRRQAAATGRPTGRDRAVSVGGRAAAAALAARLLGGGGLLGRRRRLLGLDRTAQALTVGLPAGAVGLGVLDGRRVALHAHPEGQAEVERLLVGQSELVSELVDPDLLRQRLLLPFLHVVGADTHIRPSILAHHGPGPPSPARPTLPVGIPSTVRSRSTPIAPDLGPAAPG